MEQTKSEIVNEKLQDAMSLIILLENDLSTQHSDEIYARTLKLIHQIIKSAQQELALEVE